MRYAKWFGVGASVLSVFSDGERSAIETSDWKPLCNLSEDFCIPVQKPFILGGSGTLVNTIGIAASPTAVLVTGHAVHTARPHESFTTRLGADQTITTPWGKVRLSKIPNNVEIPVSSKI